VVLKGEDRGREHREYPGQARGLEKQLKTETQEYENMQNERNAFILRVRRAAADREALRKEKDALKRTIENLRSQRNDAVLQQEQLKVTR
jgi:chromosome segregation ATPase